MGLSQIVQPFYRTLTEEENSNPPVQGQICFIPGIFPDTIPQVIEAHRHDKRDHSEADFRIRNLVESDYGPKDTLPIKNLNLKTGEELLAVKSKRRPAIILRPDTYISSAIEKVLPSMGKRHLQQADTFVALPMFSAQVDGIGTGFPTKMICRIKVLMYPQYFYMPPSTDRSIPIKEGVVRLDRIQVIVSRNPAVLQPKKYAISENALEILLCQLMRWLNLPMNPDTKKEYDAILELLGETLPANICAEDKAEKS